MKHLKLNETGGQSRSVLIETKHGKIEVFCSNDYVVVEFYKMPIVAKGLFQPIFIELNGKVFNEPKFRAKFRQKSSISMGECINDSEKKALADQWLASKQANEL